MLQLIKLGKWWGGGGGGGEGVFPLRVYDFTSEVRLGVGDEIQFRSS